MKQGVTILGSTGSIGKNTLDVISRNPEKFQVVALSANRNIDELFLQCLQYKPLFAAVLQQDLAKVLQQKILDAGLNTEVLSGQNGLTTIAQCTETDYLVAALVGAAGLMPILAAAKAGKRILLANKEALVMAGQLLIDTVKTSNAVLLPIDSEHNAIFQCWPKDYKVAQNCPEIRKIILTASGGPFRDLPLDQFFSITPEQAWTHPNWKMGKKVSIDSATMMNKSLEIIEAHWLFNLPAEKIEVLLHPQSIVHSIVEYIDGSCLAQLGNPDMRVPIANALAWPERIISGAESLNLVIHKHLQFEKLDEQRYPAVKLAYAALKNGGTASTILNAANEVAVDAFLHKNIVFEDIVKICTNVMDELPSIAANSLENILASDQNARKLAGDFINKKITPIPMV